MKLGVGIGEVGLNEGQGQKQNIGSGGGGLIIHVVILITMYCHLLSLRHYPCSQAFFSWPRRPGSNTPVQVHFLWHCIASIYVVVGNDNICLLPPPPPPPHTHKFSATEGRVRT